MGDVPTWVWQVVGAIVGGLGLGLGLGAFWQHGKKRAAKGGQAAGPQSSASTQPPEGATAGSAKPARPAVDNTPQHRLLERLRENNLQLTAQLRSSAEEHARALQNLNQEQQAERLRQERQLEELRQAHSAELSHLMSVMVEQVDNLHKEHANHVRTLEAEIERVRRDAGGVPTTPAALDAVRPPAPRPAPGPAAPSLQAQQPPQPPPGHAATELQAPEFVPTQLMDPARQP